VGDVAPSGPPTVPPDPDGPPEGPRRREAHDWDWGDDWGAPDPPAGGGGDARAEGPSEAADPSTGPSPSAAPAGAEVPAPTGGDDESSVAEDERRERPRVHPRVVRRRRAAALGGALSLLLVAVVVAIALAAGGGDEDAPERADGRLLGVRAAAASAVTLDRLQREAAVQRYARIGRPIYCGAGNKPWVALTFDDGPGELSPKFITLLSKERVPATLFRIGRNVPGHEEYVKVQRNLGWDSGTHTQNHPFLGQLSEKDQRAEIEQGNAASRQVLGRPAALFRPPYESHDAKTDRIIERLGMVEVLWNVDTQDSLGTTTADEIAATAIKGLKPGSIILMHEVKANTLTALPRIVAAIRARGLEPVTVTKMLAGDGPSERQLQKGYDGCAVDLTPGKAAS
jgi:peptidoglycan/xylan/chitin deacetylase (PgdA/CDA1 family)